MYEYVIETIDLTKIYKLNQIKVLAVEKANLKIVDGDFISLVGPSGSGKSTLLRLISGLDKSTSGQIFFKGKDITTSSEAELTKFRKQEIGFVFQLYNLIPVLTALENVELPMIAVGLHREERQKKAIELLEIVGMDKRLHHKPSELSGGEQQRVAIARALSNNPSVVIADEPTGNVDSNTGLRIFNLLYELNEEQNKTIILSTHDQKIAQKSKRLIRIKDGKIET
jgi:putative ABC transport system ATP-binding protein